MGADRLQLGWFMSQIQYAVDDFLQRPGEDWKASLVGKLVEYQKAVRLGHIELLTLTNRQESRLL